MEDDIYKYSMLKEDLLVIFPSICPVIYILPEERKLSWAEKKRNEYFYKITGRIALIKGIFATIVALCVISVWILVMVIFMSDNQLSFITSFYPLYGFCQIAFLIVPEYFDRDNVTYLRKKK